MLKSDFLLSHDWIVDAPMRVIRPIKVKDEIIDCSTVDVKKEKIDSILENHSSETIRDVLLTGESWKFDRLILFNPLVYYCAFGDDAIFRCLECAIGSLIEFGRYRYDIAVITQASDYDKVTAIGLRLGLGERLKIVIENNVNDIVDIYLSRFRINDSEVFAGRQPLIYSDCDIMVDAEIDPFLMSIAQSDKIHVAPEGRLDEGTLESSGHWYGWRMMAEDGMQFDPAAPGFSAGFIAYGHSSIALRFTSLISEVAERFQSISGLRRPFLGFDQCVANYVFLKSGIRSFDVVREAVQLYRLVAGYETQLPPVIGLGFVHFLAVPTEGKLAAMRHFQSVLYQGRTAQVLP